ncbi:MAG: transposase [Acidimicrobiaceae bacterium]|jgi:transposase-like protein|nr:transposase [Acidimicrobiaceae bacterium]
MTLSTPTMERAHDEFMDGEPTLPARPQRRRFTVAYKLAIVEKYDALSHGDKGALLRREGLYSSSVTEWRRARDAGALGGLDAKPRKDRAAPGRGELDRVTRRAERAEAKLAKAQQVIEIQGKVSVLLEQLLAESTTDDKQSRS